jgi:cobalamin synthase
MIDFSKILKGFFGAWEMLIDFMPPGVDVQTECEPKIKASCFSIVGLVIGLFIAIVSGIFSIAFNRIGGAGLFALAALLFIDCKDSGRGLQMLVNIASRRLFSKQSWEISLRQSSSGSQIFEAPIAAGMLAVLEILKLAMLFCLAYFRCSAWLGVVLCGAFFIQGVFASLNRYDHRSTYLPLDKNEFIYLWLPAAIVAVIFFFAYPLGILFVSLVVYCIVRFGSKWLINYTNGVSSDLISFCGTVTELILLFLGVLLVLPKM